jgi:hypothetical protein
MQGEIQAVAWDRPRVPRNCKTRCGWLWVVLLGVMAAQAQTCQSASDMDADVRTALETTAQRYFDMAARGDSGALRQNSIAAVAANFSGIEEAVKDNQAAFRGAHAAVRPPFVLTAEGTETPERSEFLCGVFGKSGQTADSAVFLLHNLPPGRYGVVIMDAQGGKDARTLTLILQQVGTDWKLGGFYARRVQVNEHDGAWFAQRAREFKAKGQNRNAWLYYREATALSAPVDFMSTLVTDKLYDEMQTVLPGDLPVNGKTVDVSAGAKTYHLTDVFPLAVGNDLDLVVKYQAADVSNTAQTYQENVAVTKALLAKFPEFREAFAGVIVRAVEPSGRDYGSLMAMKDIK